MPDRIGKETLQTSASRYSGPQSFPACWKWESSLVWRSAFLFFCGAVKSPSLHNCACHTDHNCTRTSQLCVTQFVLLCCRLSFLCIQFFSRPVHLHCQPQGLQSAAGGIPLCPRISVVYVGRLLLCPVIFCSFEQFPEWKDQHLISGQLTSAVSSELRQS